jgi:Spy/CpxP family protein refolding chaperone
MDVFSKNRLSFWGMAVLVVLNVVLLSTLWWGHIDRAPLQRPQGNGPARHYRAMTQFLQRELDLNAQQVEQLHTLFEQHVDQMSQVMQDMHEYRQAMHRALFAEDANSLQLTELSEQIGRKQAQVERLRFQHFKDMASLCDPSQQERLQGLVGEILLRAGPPDSGPPYGRGGGPQQGRRRGFGAGPERGPGSGPGRGPRRGPDRNPGPSHFGPPPE